jgi:hypothetical protein
MLHRVREKSRIGSKVYNRSHRRGNELKLCPLSRAHCRKTLRHAAGFMRVFGTSNAITNCQRTSKSGLFPRPAPHTPRHINPTHQRKPAAKAAGFFFFPR